MTPNQKSTVELFDESKRRLTALRERHTRAQVRLETERQALAQAKQEAREKFGTDDLQALRDLFKTRSAENDQLVMDLVFLLDDAERKLGDLERQVGT